MIIIVLTLFPDLRLVVSDIMYHAQTDGTTVGHGYFQSPAPDLFHVKKRKVWPIQPGLLGQVIIRYYKHIPKARLLCTLLPVSLRELLQLTPSSSHGDWGQQV